MRTSPAVPLGRASWIRLDRSNRPTSGRCFDRGRTGCWFRIPASVLPTENKPSETSVRIATRTRDGQSIIAYLPVGIPVSINLSKIAGPLAKAWWFSPRTAAAELIGTFPCSGSEKFQPPDHDDWVLVIDAAGANLPAPGSADCLR